MRIIIKSLKYKVIEECISFDDNKCKDWNLHLIFLIQYFVGIQ